MLDLSYPIPLTPRHSKKALMGGADRPMSAADTARQISDPLVPRNSPVHRCTSPSAACYRCQHFRSCTAHPRCNLSADFVLSRSAGRDCLFRAGSSSRLEIVIVGPVWLISSHTLHSPKRRGAWRSGKLDGTGNRE